jgi:hypothetical protein
MPLDGKEKVDGRSVARLIHCRLEPCLIKAARPARPRRREGGRPSTPAGYGGVSRPRQNGQRWRRQAREAV